MLYNKQRKVNERNTGCPWQVTKMKRYLENAFTHNYIIGFTENGKVYASLVSNDDNLVESLASFDTCKGRERFYYCQSKKKIAQLRKKTVFEVCTIEQLEQLGCCRLNKQGELFHKPNLGDAFEELVAVLMTAKQNDKQNLSFWKGGDITTTDGTQWQVKYNKATFTTLKTLEQFS